MPLFGKFYKGALTAVLFLVFFVKTTAQPYPEEYTQTVLSRMVKFPDNVYLPWNEYKTRTMSTLHGFNSDRSIPQDKYGGRTDIKFRKTGFYYAIKDNGRWWTVDPEGNAYINIGVVAVLPGESVKQQAFTRAKFGSDAKWAEATQKTLLDNGFNALGAWSKNVLFQDNRQQKTHPVSYTIIKDFMSTYGKRRGGTYQESGHIGYPDKTIFAFDPEFETFCDEYAKDLAKNKDDKNLFGYFSDNELPFERTALDRYLNKKDSTDPGCVAAKNWLASQHLTKANINDSIRQEFLGVIADRYYSVVSKAIKKYDPNHLYLGSRLHFYELTVKPFFKAVGKYVDVIAINYYRVWTPIAKDMQSWEGWSGKPFIVTEWYTKGEDSGLPNYSGAGWIVKTQNDRGLFYQNFALALLESKSCVGFHWFKYQDNDTANKKVDPSNYDANKGIVTSDYTLYSPLLERMRELNRQVYPLIDFFDARDPSVAGSASSQLKLPALVSDSMVLQRDQPVRIWGWSMHGAPVTVSFQNKTYHADPGTDQKWELMLPAMKAGRSFTMEITCAGQTRIIHEIAIGDVWLCSGQSNMAFDMAWAAKLFPNDIAQSANPDIREFHVAQVASFSPVTDVKGRWASAAPANTGAFTAAGYYMVKALYDRYKVPMGILHSSWGGSSAEAWTSEEGLKDFNNYLEKLANFSDKNKVDIILAKEKTITDAWYKEVDENDKGINRWSDPDYDISSWKTIQFPGYWETQGAPGVDGAVWVRKEIDLTPEMTEKDAMLELGIIDDVDETYFNGRKVGSRPNKYGMRNYRIPAALLKQGKNVIVIRILDTDGTGGFVPGKNYRLRTAAGDIPLTGTWRYEVGYATKALPVGSFLVLNQQPTALFNAMIAPIAGYTIKGAAWYQGETNTGRASEYQRLLPAMIADWRNRWQQGNFPFLIVQLANYKPVKPNPEESIWADMREAQDLITQKVPNTALAVAIDVGEAGDVHPLDKKTVGQRLALAAQRVAYHDNDIVYSGPRYRSMKIEGNKIILSFDNVGSGLVARGGGELKQFAIAGNDDKFIWANARIEGDRVIVWNDGIGNPVAVRYAWADNPLGANLYNKEGLPASPFRTRLPVITPKIRTVIAAPASKERFYLYLLAGQSNMAGRGFVTPVDTAGDPHILRLNRNNEWEIAKEPIHFDKDVAGVGPGLAFAREMLKRDSSIVIGLIPCAAGGSSIDVWLDNQYWEQTRSYPWNEAMARTRLAMANGTLKGILWHQGEADAAPEKEKDYPQKLMRLVEKFRSAFGEPMLPFVAGELPVFNKSASGFNPVLYEVKRTLKVFDVVSGAGLTSNPDGIHIDAASQRLFGKRYAEKMKALDQRR